jgi:hypothetical protein
MSQKRNGWFGICLTQMQVAEEKKIWLLERRRRSGVGGVEEVLIALSGNWRGRTKMLVAGTGTNESHAKHGERTSNCHSRVQLQ